MLGRLALLLHERARRQQRAAAVTPAAERWTAAQASLVAELRARYHPAQRAFYTDLAKRRAAKTTRRSGKTSGGTRESLARCLEWPGYRALYCNTTKEEARRLAWESDTRRDGWIDLLRLYGLRTTHKREHLEAGKADAFVNETNKSIDFANGSQLAMFAADDDRALEKLRGVAKHVVWVDEAQKFTNLLRFVDNILGGSMADFDGEIWLTGTPSEFAGSYFYEVTKEPSQGERLPSWLVGEWSMLDNPHFGADREARWNKACRPLVLGKKPRSYAGTDEAWIAEFLAAPPPWYRREWLGQWVLDGALFVYPVHSVPLVDLVFAPVRRSAERPRAPEGHLLESVDPELGWYDHEAAVADLPTSWKDHRGKRHRISWLYALGADFGFEPDPFALSLTAFSLEVADLYEMWSWKQVRLHPDDQRDAVRWVLAHVPGIVVSVGDAGGLQKGHLAGWRERLGVQMVDAEKASKRTWIALLGGEITSGRYHYREASPLLHEHQHLLWIEDVRGRRKEAADRRLPDGSVPGNHNSDSALYAFRHLVARRTEFGAAPLPPEVAAQREEEAMERWVDNAGLPAERANDYTASEYD